MIRTKRCLHAPHTPSGRPRDNLQTKRQVSDQATTFRLSDNFQAKRQFSDQATTFTRGDNFDARRQGSQGAERIRRVRPATGSHRKGAAHDAFSLCSTSGHSRAHNELINPRVDVRKSQKSIQQFYSELTSNVNSHYLLRSQWLQLPNPTARRRI